jgi:hypothetical protein
MNTQIALPALALLSLALAACSQAESKDATSPTDSVIGIVQCDDYLAKVNTCIQEKVPAEQRSALTAEAHQMFTTWKEAAADPQQASTLPQACSATLDAAKEDMAKYGCSL